MRVGQRLRHLDERVLNRRVPTGVLLLVVLLCAVAVGFGIWGGITESAGLWPEPIAIGLGIGAVTVAQLAKRAR